MNKIHNKNTSLIPTKRYIIKQRGYSLSFIVVLLFWSSVYVTGIADAIHGYIGWLAILSVWMLSRAGQAGDSILNAISRHKSEVGALALWTFVLLVNVLLERGDSDTANQHIKQTIVLWVVYLLAITYLYRSPVRYNITCISIVVALGLSSVIIIPALYDNVGLLRYIKYDPEQLSNMGLAWVGSTNYFSGYAVALPCLYLTIIYNKGKVRILCGVLIMLSIISIILSTMTAAVVLLFIGFVGFLVVVLNDGGPYKYKILYVSSFIIIVVTAGIYYYSGLNQINFVIEKAIHISNTIAKTGLSSVERGSDAVLSIKTIKDFPVFGSGPVTIGTFNVIGEHSTWLDNFAQYGILGFAPFMVFLYYGFCRLRRNYKLDRYNVVNGARLVTFSLYFIQGLFNPWAFDSTALTLFLVLSFAPENT